MPADKPGFNVLTAFTLYLGYRTAAPQTPQDAYRVRMGLITGGVRKEGNRGVDREPHTDCFLTGPNFLNAPGYGLGVRPSHSLGGDPAAVRGPDDAHAHGLRLGAERMERDNHDLP